MADPASLVVMASSATVALALGSTAGLHAWRGWLELRKIELGSRHRSTSELSRLRERVRQLEIIADGRAPG
jgi:hypothetical protein